MRFSSGSILVIILLFCCNALAADPTSPRAADSITMKSARAQCWDQSDASVVELTGSVHISLETAKMSSDNAVVWIMPNPGGPADSHKVQIALIGQGLLQQDGVLRMDRRLLVNAVVTGNIQLIGDRATGADESSPLYNDAAALRAGTPTTTPYVPISAPSATVAPIRPPQIPPGAIVPLEGLPGTTQAVTGPTSNPSVGSSQSPWFRVASIPAPAMPPAKTTAAVPGRVLQFDGDYQRVITSDGTLAAVVTNGITLSYRDPQQNLMEFVARNMVLFTNLKDLKGISGGQDTRHFIADHIVSAYFEGDVQVFVTPASTTTNDLRMRRIMFITSLPPIGRL